MATILSPPRVAELGMEFCGGYSLRACERDPFAANRPPLTTVAQLRRKVQSLGAAHGAKPARSMVRYVVPDCASPMEARLTLILCLPVRCGGYGLPLPVANERISFQGNARRIATKGYRSCDLFWREAGLTVEYDGEDTHTGLDNVAADSTRRNELLYQEVSMVSVTKRQLYDRPSMDRVAAIIAKRLGHRMRPTQRDWTDARIRLRRELLGTWE